MLIKSVRISISASSGCSNGLLIPVKSGIRPCRALWYNPLTSRSSHTSSGALTNISIRLSRPMISLHFWRKARVGVIKLLRHSTPEFIRIFDTSAARRIFSSRETMSKPRSLFNPLRSTSPSSSCASKPLLRSSGSKALLRVVFPDPDNPVNQITLDFVFPV